MIATHNRRDELRRTLSRLAGLADQPEEILICADGCSDGTAEMVRAEFPLSHVIKNKVARGSVYSRDRLLRLARGEIVVSFDDDSYPLDSHFFGPVQLLFQAHPRVAVFSFPEIRDDGESASPFETPQSQAHDTPSYANCAAAMRRHVYLQSSGFPEMFHHMYEEPDYALQCYALGYTVRFEPGLVIRHHVSSLQRNALARHHQNARNEIWSVLMRCPFPQILAVASYRVFRQFLYALSEGAACAVQEPLWWISTLRGVEKCLRMRAPVKWHEYYRWMSLGRARIGRNQKPTDN